MTAELRSIPRVCAVDVYRGPRAAASGRRTCCSTCRTRRPAGVTSTSSEPSCGVTGRREPARVLLRQHRRRDARAGGGDRARVRRGEAGPRRARGGEPAAADAGGLQPVDRPGRGRTRVRGRRADPGPAAVGDRRRRPRAAPRSVLSLPRDRHAGVRAGLRQRRHRAQRAQLRAAQHRRRRRRRHRGELARRLPARPDRDLAAAPRGRPDHPRARRARARRARAGGARRARADRRRSRRRTQRHVHAAPRPRSRSSSPIASTSRRCASRCAATCCWTRSCRSPSCCRRSRASSRSPPRWCGR